MLFIIINSKTQEELDRFQVDIDEHFEAVKRVELNKEKYLEVCSSVEIIREEDRATCKWDLSAEYEINQADRIYPVDMRPSKVGRAPKKI